MILSIRSVLMSLAVCCAVAGPGWRSAWSGEVAADPAAPPHYETGPTHAGGIGTYYLGREIAQVMGHQAADWLDRPGREHEENPAALVTILELKNDQVVTDVGAGTGYYSFRMAPLVARVLAVDIQQEMLDLLDAKAKQLGIHNVETVLGTISDPKLPTAGVDMALLVDVYHEFDHPIEMMTAIRKSLKPGGRVVQVEFRAEDPLVPIKTLHKMSEAQSRKEMASFGLTWVKTIETLPWQHVIIYTK
jgi:ubiquinone/menaquinone biosynthesis C-methylase UbiE